MTNVLADLLAHPARTAFVVVSLAVWVVSDLYDAPWLPVWRRFVPSLLITVALTYAVLFGDLKRFTPDDVTAIAALATSVWNDWTARNNRRNGRKQGEPRRVRVSRLTDVVRAALRREASGH